VRAERGDFGNRTDYLAVGYFYRGLNGWLSDDIMMLASGLAWVNRNSVTVNERTFIKSCLAKINQRWLTNIFQLERFFQLH